MLTRRAPWKQFGPQSASGCGESSVSPAASLPPGREPPALPLASCLPPPPTPPSFSPSCLCPAFFPSPVLHTRGQTCFPSQSQGTSHVVPESTAANCSIVRMCQSLFNESLDDWHLAPSRCRLNSAATNQSRQTSLRMGANPCLRQTPHKRWSGPRPRAPLSRQTLMVIPAGAQSLL